MVRSWPLVQLIGSLLKKGLFLTWCPSQKKILLNGMFLYVFLFVVIFVKLLEVCMDFHLGWIR